MYIRISLNDKWVKNTQINLIESKTKKRGFIYSLCKKISDKIISALEIIAKQQEADNLLKTTEPSVADELLKFKQLLDMDVITEDEFNQKKKQLLSI